MMASKVSGETRYPLIDAADADTLVVHCSDPRFRGAFQQFVRQGLEIEKPILIVVPGGIHDLVTSGREDAAHHLRQQIGFMVKLTKAHRLALFDHDDCLWHKQWAGPAREGEDPDRALKEAVEELASHNPELAIECYRAEFADGQVGFRPVRVTN